ncbi:MAG: glycosyltransferase family 4 protein [Desulfobacteraceae bacterium]|nr:glycosyltransferase family 4 protein [Desulfobacteraceae bacterium]
MSGGTRSYEMGRRLVAKGHEVNMITSWREDDGRKGWFETQEAGIRVHWLPVPYSNSMGYGERIRAFFRFAWKAAHKAAALPADVIFATSTPLTIALPGAYAAWRQKAPMVFEVRDLWPELPIAVGALRNSVLQAGARFLERFAYGRSERIVALSPGMKDGVVRAGFPAEKVSVIPNSADLDLFDPEKADGKHFRRAHPEIGDAPLVVYAGSMGKINGVDYLPCIASASKERGFGLQFAVIGKKGQGERKVRDTARKLNVLDDNFHIYPSVPKNTMPDILAAADVALSLFIDLKPMWANSANKFFDALASGTPVAINYGGWQADLLEETGAGIVLPPDDPGEAAKRIGAFIKEESKLAKAGRGARNLAEKQFSRDKLADRLEKVLLSAARAEEQ